MSRGWLPRRQRLRQARLEAEADALRSMYELRDVVPPPPTEPTDADGFGPWVEWDERRGEWRAVES